MLRKRSRSHQKDHQPNMGHPMSDAIPESYFQYDVLGQKLKTSSFFNVPGLFVGFSPKPSESDSVRSPTSPLDFRIFQNLANPLRSPRSSSHEGHHKSWDSIKVGLGIIDSLDDDDAKQSGKILRSSDSKNIVFGPQMRIKTPNFQSRIDSFEAPKSLPKNYGVFHHTLIKPSNLQACNSGVVFGIGEAPSQVETFGKILSCSLDSGRSGSHTTSFANHNTNSSYWNFGSGNGTYPVSSSPLKPSGGGQILGHSLASNLNSIPVSIGSTRDFIGSLSASEIELSEDYTCVKTYGPNPKTTHIFGDCILECHNNNLIYLPREDEQRIQLPPTKVVNSSEIPTHPSMDFLSFCYCCKKKLEGEDIYIYRGEKAFCSLDCRSQEILFEEAMERTANASTEQNNREDLSETSMFVVT